jgi:hypothetical protein
VWKCELETEKELFGEKILTREVELMGHGYLRDLLQELVPQLWWPTISTIRARGVAQVVEILSSKHEALSLNPVPSKK